MRLSWKTLVLGLGLAAAMPGGASAFCGFYVGGGGADLFNNATQVVLMRQGTRTVLSMQNNYQGPVADFAMVVPVPVVLRKDEVKTLPKEIFERVDTLSAPRLVEYWERDPCFEPPRYEMMSRAAGVGAMKMRSRKSSPKSLGVTIEAKFAVGEYKILILSAKDSTGLETWLKQEKYSIPAGAATLLRPYVQSGMKFFVAKVDVKKVQFKDGMAQLSPLRFHYDSPDFSLPIRLGMMNSAGTQDLIVHLLSPDTRYVVANYDNVSIPTNLDLSDEAKGRFGEFYAALFDDTLKKHPGAVVTEYAWDASGCDPCPTPALRQHELATLGADVLWTPRAEKPAGDKPSQPVALPTPGSPNPLDMVVPQQKRPPARRRIARRRSSFILTRLHARYGKGSAARDLVFEKAEPVVGGREFLVKDDVLEQGAVEARSNAFQARYAIRHPWTGPIKCENPVRNRWGGPPGNDRPSIQPAQDLAFAPRGKLKAAPLVKRGLASPQLLTSAKQLGPEAPAPAPAPAQPETALATPTAAPAAPVAPTAPATVKATPDSAPKGEDCSVANPGAGGARSVGAALSALGLVGLLLSRRRRRRAVGGKPGA